MSADAATLAEIRRQTERRHPEWFKTGCHPRPTAREIERVRRETPAIKKMMELSRKANQ